MSMSSSGYSPTHNSDDASLQDRRRTVSSGGGRGVANLTPAQLAKKRENDKLAQRQIRRRTKETIDDLNKQIKELREQNPQQEKSNMQQERDLTQKENEAMRLHFQQIATLVQPYLTQQAMNTLFPAFADNQSLSAGVQPFMLPPEQRQPADYNSIPRTPTQVIQPQRCPSETNPWLHQQQGSSNSAPSVDHIMTEANGPNFGQILSGWEGLNQMMTGDSASESTLHTQSMPGTTPVWTRLPRHGDPSCELDRALLAFLRHHQRAAKASTTPSQPTYPSIASLLNESKPLDHSNTNNTLSQPLSDHSSPNSPDVPPQDLLTSMTELTTKFPTISTLPEQVAVSYLMHAMMRWQIYPTRENYAHLPEWWRPRPSQLSIPHNPWLDMVQWPEMRERILADPQRFYFPEFTFPYTSQMSVNWPYDPRDCIITQDSLVRCGGREVKLSEPIINPVFERHLRRLENWSLGPIFIEKYPELADVVPVKPKMQARHDSSSSGMQVQPQYQAQHQGQDQMQHLAAAAQQHRFENQQHQYMDHGVG